jgi:opacity protein-like surface antigen
MRRLVVALGLITLASSALAADYELPTLRGSSPYVPAPPTYTRWTGFYAGGQVGYSAAHTDFSQVPASLTAFDPTIPFTAPFGLVSAWAELGANTSSAASYGAFIGFNTQWDELVLSFEANYNHTSLSTSSSDTRCYNSAVALLCQGNITLGDGNTYTATVVATGAMQVTDYGTFRFRAGWAYENVLPYAMVGIAVGRALTSRFATATGTPTGAGTAFTTTEGHVDTSMLVWGYSAGLGFDWLILPSVFLRGEYEYVSFFKVSTMRTDIHTGRVAAGFRF